MTHAPSRQPSTPADALPADWATWQAGVQAWQLRETNALLGMFTRFAGDVSAARDLAGAGAAHAALLRDWLAWLGECQAQAGALVLTMPGQAGQGWGWRLKPGARASMPQPARPVDLLEQSRLGAEMLLRPWWPAPDLDHTDEFVA